MQNLKTIKDFFRYAVSEFNKHDIFYGHGTDNPYDEARYLIFRLLNLPWDFPDNYLNTNLTENEKNTLITAIYQRTVERIPTAYILEQAIFANLEFKVNPYVLIPRSPIAELIQNKFADLINISFNNRIDILDLCTGSGCIGISSAYYLPNSKVVLSDISDEALTIANENIKLHNLNNRVFTIKSDLFKNIDADQQFDLILTNPPYVDAGELANMPAEYQYEPQLALKAGADGLDLVREILAKSANYLAEDGILICEVGASKKHLINLYPQIPFNWIRLKNGGDGVFSISKRQLRQYQHLFTKSLKTI